MVWFIATPLVATLVRPELASTAWNVVNVWLSVMVSPLASVSDRWTCIDERNGASRPSSAAEPVPRTNGERKRPSSWKLTWPAELAFDSQTSFSRALLVIEPSAATSLRCGSPVLMSTWQPMQLWTQLEWQVWHSTLASTSGVAPCAPWNDEPW